MKKAKEVEAYLAELTVQLEEKRSTNRELLRAELAQLHKLLNEQRALRDGSVNVFLSSRATKPVEVRSPFQRAVDWLPGPRLRKEVRKLVADQEAHIDELQARGQYVAVRWQKFVTWWLMLYAAALSVLNTLAGVFRGKHKT